MVWLSISPPTPTLLDLTSSSPAVQGILFHDRMKPDVLDEVRATLVGMEEAFVASNPGVKIQRVPPPKGAKGFGAK
jgi:hypothetical protein